MTELSSSARTILNAAVEEFHGGPLRPAIAAALRATASQLSFRDKSEDRIIDENELLVIASELDGRASQ